MLVAIATAAGCYAPTFKDCELACSASGTCPDGFQCNGQVCRPSDSNLLLPCPTPGMIDAPSGDTMMIDAPMGLIPHPTTMWGTPSQVSSLGKRVSNPSLTDDRLVIFATLGAQIQVASRPTTIANWSLFSPAAGLNAGTGIVDDTAYVSPDGLTMYWMSSRNGGVGRNDIWRAVRVNRTSPFSMPTNVMELNSIELDAGGSISGDGLMIVFASNRAVPSQGSDLFYATRTAPGQSWGVANRLTELNTFNDESHPILSPDKLTIYFHRFFDQAAQYELFESHRTSISQPFASPRRLMELSSGGYDGDPWVSQDGRHMFFTRDVGGENALFETSR